MSKEKGKIVKGIGGFYYVETAGAVYECKARGNFRNQNGGVARAAFNDAGNTIPAEPGDDIGCQRDAGFSIRRLVEHTEGHRGFLLFSHKSPF